MHIYAYKHRIYILFVTLEYICYKYKEIDKYIPFGIENGIYPLYMRLRQWIHRTT